MIPGFSPSAGATTYCDISFRSIHAVALDTMPGYKSEGVEHSFLERFNAMEAASDENE